jgi:hypothetical protein
MTFPKSLSRKEGDAEQSRERFCLAEPLAASGHNEIFGKVTGKSCA